MSKPVPPAAQATFCHPLLHARDWQHRPQLDEVCRWWSEGGAGVCALIGIGGAGKTAIADRFLQVLPGAMPRHPDLPKRDDLSPPERLFVFSFYDAPNPDSFFAALFEFLTPPSSPLAPPGRVAGGEGATESARPASYQQTLFALQTSGPILLVLDGLEKVQDDGLRGGIFGDLQDGRLSDLLVRMAGGILPVLSALITSRFPLAKLDEEGRPYYRLIEVEQIDKPTAISLLKQRGVHGSNDQLLSIANDCGLHALTVDLAGGYIAAFGDGDPTTPLQLTRFEDEDQARRAEPTNVRRRRVRLQEYKFTRIAERYRAALKATDLAAIALLERICLFRLGVTVDMLVSIFTGDGDENQRIASPALAGLTREQLDGKLDRLIAMKLIESTKSSGSQRSSDNSQPSFSIHAAVRDAFLDSFPSAELSGQLAAMREKTFGTIVPQPTQVFARLDGVPGSVFFPADNQKLDELEEIVHLCCKAGLYGHANEVYAWRIGGFGNLGRALGQYRRGVRICREINASATPAIPNEKLAKNYSPCFWNDWSLFLQETGDLGDATRCMDRAFKLLEQQAMMVDAARCCRNLASLHFLSGRLAKAEQSAMSAVQNAGATDNQEEVIKSQNSLDFIRSLSGTLPALGFVDRLKVSPELGTKPLTHGHANQCALILSLSGQCTEAIRICSDVISSCFKDGGEVDDMFTVRARLILANCLIAETKPEQAKEHVNRSLEWAEKHDVRQIACWSKLVGSKSDLSGDKARRIAEPEQRNQATATALCISLEEGLRIARDCGYGIYHIDLLAVRARLHLLCGEPDAALDDLRTALDDGVPANDHTGQPELLAATHAECGYAWGIAEGLSLRAEALLLQAAQTLGQDSFVPAKRNDLPTAVRDLITQAESCLTQALDRWHSLRDPEPNNANFCHPQTGTEYNYRAAETYGVLDDFKVGIFTRCPLRIERSAIPNDPNNRRHGMRTRVYLSFSASEDEFRRELREVLIRDVRLRDLFWDDLMLKAGEDFLPQHHQAVAETRIMIMLVSPRYLDQQRCQAWKYEIPPAIDAYRKGELTIMWIPARPVRASDTPFPEIQSAHPLSQPLDTLNEADRQHAYERIKQFILQKLGLDQMDSFHVFLSHNSKDKPSVKQLGLELKQRGLNPWLDEWELRPGLGWQDALEDIIKTCGSAAICVADSGIGPWEDPEMKALLRRFVNEKKVGNVLPVIPVLLPGAPADVKLPVFLEEFIWVDLRSGLTKQGLDRLVWGITGKRPNP